MFFYTAVHQLVVVAEHVAGRDNEAADAISRVWTAVFHSLIPQVCLRVTVVPVEPPDNNPARMDVQRLEESVLFYFAKGLVPSTQRSYRSGQQRYITLCGVGASLTPTPVNEAKLCSFVARLADEHQTIKVYLSVVRHLQISEGPFHGAGACPNCTTCCGVLRSMSRRWARVPGSVSR